MYGAQEQPEVTEITAPHEVFVCARCNATVDLANAGRFKLAGTADYLCGGCFGAATAERWLRQSQKPAEAA